jgi:hypothetical protein
VCDVRKGDLWGGAPTLDIRWAISLGESLGDDRFAVANLAGVEKPLAKNESVLKTKRIAQVGTNMSL